MQQINLYLPEFQPNREPFRAIHILWGVGALLVLLLLLLWYVSQGNKQLQLQLEQDRLQLDKLTAQLNVMNAQRPKHDLARMDQEILSLTADLTRRNQILDVVANKDLGNNVGFSEHLNALGRQSMDTIALDVFSLQKGGTYVEFSGKTTAADQVPLYIQRLRQESAFANVGFGVLTINSGEGKGGALAFSLAQNQAQDKNSKNPKASTQTPLQKLTELNHQARGSY